MKNIALKILAILSVGIFLTGCIKENLPEGSTQTKAQVAKNESALNAMVDAIMVKMTASGTAGHARAYGTHTDFGMPAIHFMTENLLEDLATLSDNPWTNRFVAQGFGMNVAMGSKYINCSYFWDCYYTWIKIANDVIGTIGSDVENLTPEKKQYLGIAHAYRAAFYLDLARLYEPQENKYTDVSKVLGLTVPIVTEATTEQDAVNNPRATHEQMYKFILEDLTLAEQYLDPARVSYLEPNIHMVNALRARAYLEMGAKGDAGAYEKAAEFAGKVIAESGKTPLTQEQWENPKTGFNSGKDVNSWIWGLTVSSENIGNLLTFTSHASVEATWGYGPYAKFGINRKLYTQINDNDFRKHSWIDPKGFEFYNYKLAGKPEQQETFKSNIEPYMSLKFRPAQGEVSDWKVGGCAEHPMIRIEEMYFVQAEALAKLNKLSEAEKVLNTLIQTRNPEYDVTKMVGDVKGFISELFFQKRIEFWGEGVLVFDYKRLNQGIERGYPGTNHQEILRFNTDGCSPDLNIVITRTEFQSNKAITDDLNNPDPSGLLKLWKD